jgi:GIY-YIG catalytic domain-containing protein
MKSAPERTALYRIYDTAGDLLYVGISKDFGYRWKQHAKAQPWWPEVQRQTVEWHPDRPTAAASEVAAIEAEKPRYNITHAVIRPHGALVQLADNQILSDQVRLHFRATLSRIQHDGAHLHVVRYSKPVAVLIPVDWYEQAKALISKEGQS